MNYFDMYIILIFIAKIIFIVLALYMFYLKAKKPTNKKLIQTIKTWKERAEFIFISLMSILLVYVFNPRSNNINLIDKEAKLLLFLFGIVLLFTENWSSFIHESPILKKFQVLLA